MKNQRIRIITLTIAIVATNLVLRTDLSNGQVPTLPNEVWIAIRTDGQRGTGTIVDPYDGSSAAGFDAIFDRYDASNTSNVTFHLGPGTFPTDVRHQWYVLDGWWFVGSGMDVTTIQMVGNLTGIHYGIAAVAGRYNATVSGGGLRDLTIDCNWPGLANSADDGTTVRTFNNTSAATNSPTIISTDGGRTNSGLPLGFTELDVGRRIKWSGSPSNLWIGVVNSSTSIGVSSSPIENIPVNVTVPSGTAMTVCEKNVKTGAIGIFGANGWTIERIHGKGAYGTLADGQECFVIALNASTQNPEVGVSNNVVRFCLVDGIYGNYGNPFLYGGGGVDGNGNPFGRLYNSSVEFCAAYGRQGIIGYSAPGSASPFTGGGVNMGGVDAIRVRGNRFEDCYAIAYSDTNGYANLDITDNRLVRGWAGLGFGVGNPDQTLHDVLIQRNRIGVQRRVLGGANYGISIGNDFPNLVIDSNFLTYDPSGPGTDVFWPMQIHGTSGVITNNVIDLSPQTIADGVYDWVGDAGVTNGAPDSRFIVSNNRTVEGNTIAGLAPDTVVPTDHAGGDVWIAIRTDGLNGSGTTQADPYDGSTQAKFDAVMGSIADHTRIHLGAGTFRTAAYHSWAVKTAWVIEGAGIDSTIVQIAGPLNGIGGSAIINNTTNPLSKISRIFCFSSPNNISTDDVILRNFTVDCNSSELFSTATIGAAQSLTYSVGAIYIFGSNNLVEDVKSINSYGSLASLSESFAIGLANPLGATSSTGNIIRFCHAESPMGDYGAPFALHGCADSSVYGNLAIGYPVANSGVPGGFNAGGVDGADLTNCEIYNNTFIDCMGAFFGSSGAFNNVKIFNNNVVRGWLGVAFNPALPKQDIQISGNSFSIQDRLGAFIGSNAPLAVNVPTIAVGTSYGIVVGGGPSSNTTIFNNNLTFAGGLTGDITVSESWGIVAGPIVGGVVANNTVDSPNNAVFGAGVTFFNNRQPNGTGAPGL